jgi:hypothetical protein
MEKLKLNEIYRLRTVSFLHILHDPSGYLYSSLYTQAAREYLYRTPVKTISFLNVNV